MCVIGNAPHNHEPQYHTAGFRIVHHQAYFAIGTYVNVIEACVCTCVTKINTHIWNEGLLSECFSDFRSVTVCVCVCVCGYGVSITKICVHMERRLILVCVCVCITCLSQTHIHVQGFHNF